MFSEKTNFKEFILNHILLNKELQKESLPLSNQEFVNGSFFTKELLSESIFKS